MIPTYTKSEFIDCIKSQGVPSRYIQRKMTINGVHEICEVFTLLGEQVGTVKTLDINVTTYSYWDSEKNTRKYKGILYYENGKTAKIECDDLEMFFRMLINIAWQTTNFVTFKTI